VVVDHPIGPEATQEVELGRIVRRPHLGARGLRHLERQRAAAAPRAVDQDAHPRTHAVADAGKRDRAGLRERRGNDRVKIPRALHPQLRRRNDSVGEAPEGSKEVAEDGVTCREASHPVADSVDDAGDV
jgi:hypothetical protein